MRKHKPTETIPTNHTVNRAIALSKGCALGLCGVVAIACGSTQKDVDTPRNDSRAQTTSPANEARSTDTVGSDDIAHPVARSSAIGAIATIPPTDPNVSEDDPHAGHAPGVTGEHSEAEQAPIRDNDVRPDDSATVVAVLSPIEDGKQNRSQSRTQESAMNRVDRQFESGDAETEGELQLVEGEVGRVRMEQNGNVVKIMGAFQGLKPGLHGLHIRDDGQCLASRKARHFNPTNSKHGPPSSSVRHAGDLGNILVDEDGRANFEMKTDSFTVEGGHSSVQGLAIVVTMKEDRGLPNSWSLSGQALACGTLRPVGDLEPMASNR